MCSLYIYGIISARAPLAFAVGGLAGGIRLLGEGDIAAIVGKVPPGWELLRDDREQTSRLLTQHRQILEAAIAQATVLPVKFGTLAPDEHAVRHMLSQGRAALQPLLAEFEGRVQMDIVVEWALEQVFAEIAAQPGIAELRANARSGGEAAKIRLGEAVKAGLDRRRAMVASGICVPLRDIALDMVANTLPEDRMVANVALLVERGSLAQLDGTLALLDAATAGNFSFRCVGPLPPSAFATVEISFPPRDVIAWARHALGLGAKTTIGEIRSSYRRLAHEHHPDTAGRAATTMGARLDEITKAYRLLAACAKTYASGDEACVLPLDGSGLGLVVIQIARQGEDIEDPVALAAVREDAA